MFRLWLISDGQWGFWRGCSSFEGWCGADCAVITARFWGGAPAVWGWCGVIRPSAMGRGGRYGNATAPGRGTARGRRLPEADGVGR